MKLKILYISIFLLSLTTLPHCKSSPEDTGTDKIASGDQPTNANTEASKVNLEAPKMSDVPALLKLDPPVPLLQDILPEIRNTLNDNIIDLIRLLYACEYETEDGDINHPTLRFKFTELYNPDATTWGNTLCKIDKIHEEEESSDKYIKSETDRYHCRKELSKIISEHQETGYNCYTTTLYVGVKNKWRHILIF